MEKKVYERIIAVNRTNKQIRVKSTLKIIEGLNKKDVVRLALQCSNLFLFGFKIHRNKITK